MVLLLGSSDHRQDGGASNLPNEDREPDMPAEDGVIDVTHSFEGMPIDISSPARNLEMTRLL